MHIVFNKHLHVYVSCLDAKMTANGNGKQLTFIKNRDRVSPNIQLYVDVAIISQLGVSLVTLVWSLCRDSYSVSES